MRYLYFFAFKANKCMIKLYTSHKRGVTMIKDRGNKKWISLMLVEHRKGLEEILEHEDDVDMPVLDEQKLEEFERSDRKEQTCRSNIL